MSDIMCQTSYVRYVSDVRFRVFDGICRTLYVRHYVRLHVSDIVCRMSCVGCHMSDIMCQMLYVRCRMSDVMTVSYVMTVEDVKCQTS